MESTTDQSGQETANRMSTEVQTAQAKQVETAVTAAGLKVAGVGSGTDFSGAPTVRYELERPDTSGRSQVLELSSEMDLDAVALREGLDRYLLELVKRLRNPRPDCYLTLTGLPLSFGRFAWPFHASTSGADTFLVHGEIKLEDGEGSPLHAKIAASMTVTFAEVVAAPEQPFAEGFIYNAVRKTMDQGQLELVKSGNRQPVPVTTRYYSAKQGKFVFNDTNEAQRSEFLAAKTFWLSGALGGGEPVWLLDPRDAQYLNTTVDELRRTATALAGEGVIRLANDTEFATPTEALMDHRAEYLAEMQEALTFIKPSFNESMRGGHTNM
jgi:hypothetical protein